MSKVNQLYSMIQGQGESGSNLSCTVIYSGILGQEIFTGFLQEDPKIANRSTYNTNLPGFAGTAQKAAQLATKAVDTVSGLMTAADGGGQMLNPLQARNLWQGNEFNSFDVTVYLYTLDENTNVLQKARRALELTSPIYTGGGIMQAPGGYLYGADGAFSQGNSHAQNTWAIKLGNHFCAMHLACTGVNITVSKETVRLGNTRDYDNLSQPTAPLYVQLSFSFITDRIRFSNEANQFIIENQGNFKAIGDPRDAPRSFAGILDFNNKGKGWLSSAFGSVVNTAVGGVKGIGEGLSTVANNFINDGGTNGNV